MHDLLGRKIDYMRLSITDRCNLRCKYCMPEEGVESIPHDSILRYEEIMKVVKAAIKIGIINFKVTGGEPLVRKGCIGFLRDLKAVADHITLTTNGILLGHAINDLVDMKLDGINISLDSLNPKTYAKITGSDKLPTVLSSLEEAVKSGIKIKINCVPLLGINDSEIEDIARLTEVMPLDVRFIEHMAKTSIRRITGSEILSRLNATYPDLEEDPLLRGMGPARYFKSGKMQGSIGIIDAIENCFCAGCNRVRLTSDGFLKLCLFHDDGVDMRGLIRGGASQEEIGQAFSQGILTKPKRHRRSDIKNMSQIGG